MMTEMTGSPIMGRSSTRSRRSPSETEKARVSRKAAQSGTCAEEVMMPRHT